ncbi:MAG TPA: methyltransferase domain-containing protein [Allosphingosinicella sp.]|nr:methyltransferase domain-containing protein [Allosphingosinicella sp.]
MARWLAGQFRNPHGLAGRWLIGPWLDRISRAMNALVLAELDPQPGDRMLEIGFGGGGLIAALLARGAQVVGADMSEAMVARARRRFGGRAEILHASVEALPLAGASADTAASVNNIYFWPDPAGGVAELARVLRPGGLLAIAFEPPEELAKWSGHKHGFRLWSEAEVRALMAAAGFERIRSAWGTGRKPDRFLCLTGVRGAAGTA